MNFEQAMMHIALARKITQEVGRFSFSFTDFPFILYCRLIAASGQGPSRNR
jgi:hypothetical protein